MKQTEMIPPFIPLFCINSMIKFTIKNSVIFCKKRVLAYVLYEP
jgi:hypothetical protein